MLQRLAKNSEKVFGNIAYSTMRNNLNDQKKRIAEKLQNPRIRRITPHAIRHWRASIEYHRGAGLIEIIEMLGHSSLRSTLVYTHLMKRTEKDEYISRATRSVKGARALIESGFQYITEIDGLKLFRKRK
jgi:integrase